jgi:hypothetical protein
MPKALRSRAGCAERDHINAPRNSAEVLSAVQTLLNGQESLRIEAPPHVVAEFRRRADTGEGVLHLLNLGWQKRMTAAASIRFKWDACGGFFVGPPLAGVPFPKTAFGKRRPYMGSRGRSCTSVPYVTALRWDAEPERLCVLRKDGAWLCEVKDIREHVVLVIPTPACTVPRLTQVGIGGCLPL